METELEAQHSRLGTEYITKMLKLSKISAIIVDFACELLY